MNEQRKVDICFSPFSYPLYRMENSIVVVVDIFRATSAFCTAFQYGVKRILPLADVEETRRQRENGYLLAGERDGVKLEGFDFGNSPYDFMDGKVEGQQIAFTTTNGTQAIDRVKDDAEKVVVGSFLNLTALIDWLATQDRNVLFLCSGWKNKMNFEDTLFAGLASQLLLQRENFFSTSDSIVLAQTIYKASEKDILNYICESSPRIRRRMNSLEKDFRYCLLRDQTDVVPVYHKGYLVEYKNIEE